MVDLQRERLPTARRAAGEQAGARLRNHAVMLLQVGDQFLQQGVAIGPVIG